MSDNELDNLFKEAADGFKVPHDPTAWQGMSGKLDQAAATTSTFWNWKTISTMAVVSVVSVAVISYLVTGNSENTNTPEVISNQSIKRAEPGKSGENKVTKTNSTLSQREKSAGDSGSKEGSIIEPPESEQNSNNIAAKERVVDNEKIQGTEEVIQYQNESKNPARVLTEEIPPLAVVQVPAVETQASGSSLESSAHQNQRNATDEETAAVKKSSQLVNDSLSKQAEGQTEAFLDSAQSNNEKTRPEVSGNKFMHTLGVKLAIAPDYTSVKSSTPDRLGFGFGILLEYRFSDHWSIATGSIWTKKIYTAYDVEYNGYNADWVDGDCRMWDIPVNVYYTFSPNRPFSFYTGLGLSSYLMNEENYIFYVTTPYGVYDYPRQIKGENNEWFKTLNISIGMQLRLNNKFTLQLEPILKAPLTGVGEGEVSLVSLGAFFNVRFDIPINKTGTK